jgi:hypothetical protein
MRPIEDVQRAFGVVVLVCLIGLAAGASFCSGGCFDDDGKPSVVVIKKERGIDTDKYRTDVKVLVRKGSGPAPRGTEVVLWDNGPGCGTSRYMVSPKAWTDGSGSVEFRGVVQGEYLLSVDAGEADRVSKRIRVPQDNRPVLDLP